MRRSLVLLLGATILLMLMLIGCSSPQPSASIVCAIFSPVYIKDAGSLSKEEKRAIAGNNVTWEKLCQ